MCYMIEGESSKTFIKTRKFLNQHLQTSSRLLQQLTDLIVDYLVLQVQAGAQVNKNTDVTQTKEGNKERKSVYLSVAKCKIMRCIVLSSRSNVIQLMLS